MMSGGDGMHDKQELTVYKNELNTVPFRKFNAVEMDLFFSICSKMRNQGLKEIRYSFKDLKKLSNYSNKHKERFINDLEKVYSKMTQLSYREEDVKKIKYFVLFSGFEIDKEEEYVEISVNPKLEHIINRITGEFTKFELEEFTNLNSSYSKTAFRLLKQFRQTGFWKVNIYDFKELLDVPESYGTADLNKRVLKPIQEELSKIFKNLRMTKIKAKNGKKTEYLEFKFKAEDDMNKRNEKTFRDSDGNYYQKDLFHLTQEEENKAFPSLDKN